MRMFSGVHAIAILTMLVGCGVLSDDGDNSRKVGLGGVTPLASLVDLVVGSLGSIRQGANTHVLVVGYSNGQGDQFVQSAVARAKRFRALYPNENILFLASPELEGKCDDLVLKRLGIKLIFTSKQVLDLDFLADQFAKYKNIASVDFFSHAGPAATYLSSNGGKVTTKGDIGKLRAMRHLFNSRSFVTLNGCVAGLYLAPFLSDAWGVAVSGAAEGTNFSQLHSNGNWYINDKGRFPPGGWAKINRASFPESVECGDGGCLRMKSEGHPYPFFGANAQGLGLGFYKFFCPTTIDKSDCEERMALSLLAYPSTVALTTKPDEVSYRQVLLDFLCPIESDPAVRRGCVEGTLAAERMQDLTYSPFKGRSLQCGFQGCSFEMKCADFLQGTIDWERCSISDSEKIVSTTYMREYFSYLRGWHGLTKGGGPKPTPSPTVVPTAVPTAVPTPSGRCQERPLGEAGDFQVVLRDSWNAYGSDIEGRAAVGGNVHLEHYSIGVKLDHNPNRVDLLVGGRLWFRAGGIPNGYAVTRELELYDSVSAAADLKVDPNLSTSHIFASVEQFALSVAALTRNGDVEIADFGGPRIGVTLMGHAASVNIYEVDAAVLARAHTVRIQQPSGSTAIVRIRGSELRMGSLGFLIEGAPNSGIVWAALDAERIEMSGLGLIGVLLAPRAIVRFDSGLLTGQVFSAELSGNGQINLNQFSGCIPVSGGSQPQPQPQPGPFPQFPDPSIPQPIPPVGNDPGSKFG